MCFGHFRNGRYTETTQSPNGLYWELIGWNSRGQPSFATIHRRAVHLNLNLEYIYEPGEHIYTYLCMNKRKALWGLDLFIQSSHLPVAPRWHHVTSWPKSPWHNVIFYFVCIALIQYPVSPRQQYARSVTNIYGTEMRKGCRGENLV